MRVCACVCVSVNCSRQIDRVTFEFIIRISMNELYNKNNRQYNLLCNLLIFIYVVYYIPVQCYHVRINFDGTISCVNKIKR